MIEPKDLGIRDETIARRILVHARTFAPCLDTLDADARQDAIAILAGVAREAQTAGARGIASKSVGTARISYREVVSFFTDDDRAALRALCGLSASGFSAGYPVGSFPRHPDALGRFWPEEEG